MNFFLKVNLIKFVQKIWSIELLEELKKTKNDI